MPSHTTVHLAYKAFPKQTPLSAPGKSSPSSSQGFYMFLPSTAPAPVALIAWLIPPSGSDNTLTLISRDDFHKPLHVEIFLYYLAAYIWQFSISICINSWICGNLFPHLLLPWTVNVTRSGLLFVLFSPASVAPSTGSTPWIVTRWLNFALQLDFTVICCRNSIWISVCLEHFDSSN